MNITIIGTGHVAGFFGKTFLAGGCRVLRVIGRDPERSAALASVLSSGHGSGYDIPAETELLMLAVSDDAIAGVAAAIPEGPYIVCHCAGAVSVNVLEKFENRAVIYPLQSIRDLPAVKDVPVLIETSGSETGEVIGGLLEKSGFRYAYATSDERKIYHLAAVFANNFSNAMLTASERILKEGGLNKELLMPLIRKTFENALTGSASGSQTGPALRGDLKTMRSHLGMLSNSPDLQALYRQVSQFISGNPDILKDEI